MPVRDIRARIGVDGEKEFNAAMAEAARNMKNMDAEMRKASAAYDLSGDKAEYLAEKSRLLGDKMQQQEEIVAGLKHQLEQAESKYGETGSQTDKLRQKLTRAETEMLKLQKATQDADQDLEELGRDSTRIGRQLENGIGDAADDISDKLDNMVREIEQDLSDIGGAVEFSAFKDAGEMVVGAFEQLSAFTEQSEDYRRSMSFLEQNAKNAGFEFEYVKGLLFDAASLTGDLDGAFEGVNNLLAAGFDGKELEEAIDLIGGAAIRFPETMKFETLAESLQESVATGSATGAYAELLERLGVDLETVNKSLGEAETAEQRQQIALAYLNGHALDQTVENYESMNEDMIKAEKSQLLYNDAIAGLGKALEPTVTKWVEFKTQLAEGATELINGGFDEWLGGLNEKLVSFRENSNNWMQNLLGDETYQKLFGGEREAGIVGEYAGLVQLGEEQGTAYGSAYGAAAQASLTQAINTLNDSANTNAQTIGSNISTAMGNGITESTGNATAAANNLWESIRAILTQTISIPKPQFDAASYNGTGRTTASSYAAGGQGTTIEVTTTIDSESVGRSTYNTIDGMGAAQTQRASTYGR